MPMASNLRSVFWPPQNLLLLFLLPLLPGPFLLEAAEPLDHFCISTGNFTVNSTYHRNLNSLLGSIYTESSINGFYNLSSGQSPDQVNAIALCRGDVSTSDCQACLKNSSVEIARRCPVEKEAVIWYDDCMIRYSNQSIYGVIDWVHVFFAWNTQNVTTSVPEFSRAVNLLMNGLRMRAAAGNSTLKFAAGNTPGPDSTTIYGLAQCTPDLSELQCNQCLVKAINDTSTCCTGRRGARVVGTNCNVRFELNQFYNPSAETSLAPTGSPPALSPTPLVSSPTPPDSPPNPSANSPGDLLVHHVIALCSYITTLILLKAL